MKLTINECIKILKEEVKDPYALSYINALPESIEYGTEGLKVQLIYVLSNCHSWKSENSQLVKNTIKEWCDNV